MRLKVTKSFEIEPIKYVNAEKKFDMKTFFSSYCYVWIIMLFVLIIPITIFCFVFKESLCDPNIWINIVLGIFSYIGTCFLGIFTFYFSWKQNIIESNKLLPSISVNYDLGFNEDGCFCLYNYNDIKKKVNSSIYAKDTHLNNKNEDFVYCHIILTNLSHIEIVDINAEYYVRINEDKFQKEYSFIVHSKEKFPLDYKQTYNLYFGVNKEHINNYNKDKKYQTFKFILKINDRFDKEYCIVCDCTFGDSLTPKTYFVNPNLYLNDKNEFPERVLKQKK